MSQENQTTIQAYEKVAQGYVDLRKQEFKSLVAQKINDLHQKWLQKTLANVSKEAKLFEIGSGSGRDAMYIQSLGYTIQPTDAAQSFLKIMRDNGLNPIKFDLITDNFNEKYDYILANAVLVHFTKADVELVVRKIHDALNDKGIFALAVKYKADHEGGEWLDADELGEKRFFNYYDKESITALLEYNGFIIKSIEIVGGLRSNWLDIIAVKKGGA